MTKQSQMVSYELVLLQFRPDVTSGELVNIGAVAFSPDSGLVAAATTERYGRLKAVYADLDGVAFRSLSRGIRARAASIAKETKKVQFRLDDRALDMSSLLDRIVPPGSSNFAWSSVRYGTCGDLDACVRETFEEYIGRHEQSSVRERIDDEHLWRRVLENKQLQPLLQYVNKPHAVHSPEYSYNFRGSWMNGRMQVAEPISLDYANPRDMLDEAVRWKGIMNVLSERNDFRLTALVTDPPTNDEQALRKYQSATALLRKTEHVREVIPASKVDRLGELVREDLHLSRSK